ncbi:MAG: hypothetical protein CMF52_03375 [Legionellales bacterium]|nr:hypothetical protein [Legionellales bacterium]|tara:strand:- start:189 stop:557 length:369 start_codon:yes stop_codon:yes gene_type:complete
MSALAVKLPITKDSINGYTMIDDFTTLVKQNLKMLVLTSKGERIMEPEFGVGIKDFLFENFNNMTFKKIDTSIRKQVEMFMPAVSILDISFAGSEVDKNLLGVSIFFSIPSIDVRDLLEFTI